MAHNRKIVLSGIALTKARIPQKINGRAANRARDEIEKEIIQSDYLAGAPFSWIGISVRYGLINENEPNYEGIDVEDGELSLTIEIDVHRLLGVSEDEMTRVYRRTILVALLHAGKKYELNTAIIERLLQ